MEEPIVKINYENSLSEFENEINDMKKLLKELSDLAPILDGLMSEEETIELKKNVSKVESGVTNLLAEIKKLYPEE